MANPVIPWPLVNNLTIIQAATAAAFSDAAMLFRAYADDMGEAFTAAGFGLKAEMEDPARYYSGRDMLFVSYHDALPVGTLAVKYLDDARGELCRMFVLPEYRRQGVGDAMIDVAEATSQQAGLVALYLASHQDFTAAHAAYLKRGYTRTECYGEHIPEASRPFAYFFSKSLRTAP